MVIGNGFFSDTREDALEEMKQRSKCEVKHLPYSTIGNIDYFISETGDLYGVQRIQGKCLTRTKSPIRYKYGYSARLTTAPHKEQFLPLAVLVYCAFVLNRWEPDVQLEHINGNVYDCRPANLRPKVEDIPPEWSQRMKQRQDVYKREFTHVCWSANYICGLDFQDCKDAAQSAFIYLCTDGFKPIQNEHQEFVGLWIKIARLRALDIYRRRIVNDYDAVERLRSYQRGFEFDFYQLQPGKKRERYLRMYMEGNTPTEIAKECNVSLGSVSSSVTRSIQFMQRYFKKDIDQWMRK